MLLEGLAILAFVSEDTAYRGDGRKPWLLLLEELERVIIWKHRDKIQLYPSSGGTFNCGAVVRDPYRWARWPSLSRPLLERTCSVRGPCRVSKRKLYLRVYETYTVATWLGTLSMLNVLRYYGGEGATWSCHRTSSVESMESANRAKQLSNRNDAVMSTNNNCAI